MAIPFDDIEEGFGVIREAFVDDAEPLIGQGRGGSYAASILIVIGHEELARLRLGGSGRGAESFAETLPRQWSQLAPSLHGALRNGLAHGYGTQTIIVSDRRIVLGFSLTPEPLPHRFDPRPVPEMEADAAVMFNTRTLAVDLRHSFDRLEADLRRNGELRDAFSRRWIRGRTRVVRSQEEAQVWRQLLAHSGGYAARDHVA